MKKICCLAALWMANLTPLSAATVPFAHDLAVYDSLIANLKPGQEIVPFGDVGITPEQLHAFHDRLVRLQAQGPQTSALTPSGTTFKWPGGNVYYRFDPAQVSNGTITALKMQQFRDAVAEWSAFANLHFIEFSGTPPANYVTASENPSLGGGYSNSVGMKGGEQLAQFGSNAWNRGTICHEIGHALGLWHEQQRPDRETYVHVHTENLADPNDGNFTIVPDGQTFGSAYDFYSVMHYSRNALSNTGQDVITMQPGYTQYIDVIGKVYDRTLSKIERATMATIYGNPATLPSAIVTNTADSGSGSLRTAIYYAFDRSPAATTVTFAIPTSDANYDSSAGVFRVRPTYELVAPGNATTIDGSTQVAGANASGPKIVLDGSNFTALKAAPFYYSGHGFLLRAANCTVKGFTITGFSDSGVKIFQGTDPTGGAPTGNVIDSNRISNCGSYGIEMSGATATANIAKANYVGTDQTGNSAQPNAYAGVVLYGGAHGNTIGPGNVISGNTYQGLTIDGAGSSGNIVTGNYIGTKANGTAALPNGSAGLSIYNSATSNLISGNVLSGNFYQGLTISDSGTTGNLVQGNLIGTDKNGAAAIPNQSAGLSIYNGAQANTIGGVVPGTRNVISGNSYQAITIDGAGTNGNFVQGNFIGLDLTGLLSLANNSTDVQISNGAQTNTIGGTQAGARNYICSSPYYGVALIDSTTAGNLVQGNSIGVNLAGVARGNNYQGVVLFSGAHNNLIGGSAIGASNLISGNFSDGLAQFTNTTAQNTFSRNSIDGNNYRGIALYDGSNNSQPFPAISSAVLGLAGNISGLDVAGTYSGAAGTLEFFGSPAADSSGFGEGKTYLGSLAISGPGSFTAHLAAAAPAGTVVAVSATDALGNTSEFSQAISITSTDNGSDGMPDAWMLTYFGHIDPRSNDKSRASDDADGDGLTNLQEFLAGTNPKAANSAFRIATIARSANSVSLTFPSVSGKTYRVEEKDSLTQIAWTLLQDQISATSTTTMIVDPIGSSAMQRFYRVVLEP